MQILPIKIINKIKSFIKKIFFPERHWVLSEPCGLWHRIICSTAVYFPICPLLWIYSAWVWCEIWPCLKGEEQCRCAVWWMGSRFQNAYRLAGLLLSHISVGMNEAVWSFVTSKREKNPVKNYRTRASATRKETRTLQTWWVEGI